MEKYVDVTAVMMRMPICLEKEKLENFYRKNRYDIMGKMTAEKFEGYFQQWLEEIQKPEIMISSDTADYINNEPYQKIIKLGKDSLPSIINKIAQGYFFLNHAVSEITGKKISEIISGGMTPTSQQEISRLWLMWWKKQKHTRRTFF